MERAKVFSWVGSTAFAAAGFVGGLAAKDFIDFSGKQREVAQKAIEQSISASDTLAPLIQKFANQALGKALASDMDRDELRSALQKQYAAADLTAKNLPSVRSEFEAYADAIIQLQQSAVVFKGPQDAKAFVQDLSRYYASESAFRDAALAAQRSYWRNLIRSL